jgi:hypothetical protein
MDIADRLFAGETKEISQLPSPEFAVAKLFSP